MLQRYARDFYELGGYLALLNELAGQRQVLPTTNDVLRRTAANLIPLIRHSLKALDLSFSLTELARWNDDLLQNKPLTDLENAISVLSSRIKDELENRYLLYVDPGKAWHYESFHSEWEVALASFNVATDVEEAEKCYALNRFTACVFHLMRVVEIGVQEFGKLFGVVNTSEKTWADISNEIKQKLDGLPDGTTNEKERKTALHEVKAHLDSVRWAWRNTTMHPKQTYTEQEAHEILDRVCSFMARVVGVV